MTLILGGESPVRPERNEPRMLDVTVSSGRITAVTPSRVTTTATSIIRQEEQEQEQEQQTLGTSLGFSRFRSLPVGWPDMR